MELDGKVAIVTGAGQGVGRGIAIALAKARAAVVVLQRNADTGARTAGEIEDLGENAIAVAGDVRAPPTARRRSRLRSSASVASTSS